MYDNDADTNDTNNNNDVKLIEDSNSDNDNNDIEVVVNDDTDLEISPVYEHLNVARPRPQENKEEIIIPEVTENKEEKQDN